MNALGINNSLYQNSMLNLRSARITYNVGKEGYNYLSYNIINKGLSNGTIDVSIDI